MVINTGPPNKFCLVFQFLFILVVGLHYFNHLFNVSGLTPQHRLNSAVVRCLTCSYFIKLSYDFNLAIASPWLSDRLLPVPSYPDWNFCKRSNEFDYTFDHLTEIVEKFITALDLKKYSLYVMDYGAPVGYRIATKYPERVQALIVQNGNAYEEGLREFTEPMKTYWQDPSSGMLKA
jgi:hypothetical protein